VDFVHKNITDARATAVASAYCQGAGRPMKPRMRGVWPDIDYSPETSERNRSGKEPLILTYNEFEALRLVDQLGLTQEEAAERRGISRGTVWRCRQHQEETDRNVGGR
jgi:predicted DNA-binding protein (UPF0251 family)